MSDVKQYPCKPYTEHLTLIPPLAEDFSVYGNKDVIERARNWALDGHYLLARGVEKCAHGLYLMSPCPANCHTRIRDLDHPNIWVPASPEHGRPFLLSHPYKDGADAMTVAYADSHGLRLTWGDEARVHDWYWAGVAVKMTVPDNWPLWPIEAEAAVLLSTQPVAWPSDDDWYSREGWMRPQDDGRDMTPTERQLLRTLVEIGRSAHPRVAAALMNPPPEKADGRTRETKAWRARQLEILDAGIRLVERGLLRAVELEEPDEDGGWKAVVTDAGFAAVAEIP